MVEDIIKAVNHQYVYVSKNQFDEMKINCKEKLLACAQRNSGKFEAFFDCLVNEQELIELLKICESAQTTFLGLKKEQAEKNIQIYNHPIFPGECLTFDNDIMLLQDVPSDCFIECYGKLIVVGCIRGCIDLIYQDSSVIASSFQNSRIQIFDTGFQNLTYFSCTLLYYENSKIVKEDNTWEVVLESPLAKAV